MVRANDLIRIGEVVSRSGVAASALRFYESLGLIQSQRPPDGSRGYPRYVFRRVALIRIIQRMGLTLEEIGDALAVLPSDRAPTKAEGAKLSRSWRRRLHDRISTFEALRHAGRGDAPNLVPPMRSRRIASSTCKAELAPIGDRGAAFRLTPRGTNSAGRRWASANAVARTFRKRR
jgi:MerR family redox-sensitive transcriptional activator SoxR